MFLPIPGDPYYESVVLLLPMNGENSSTTFTDYSVSPKTVTAYGNAQISTAQSKFGGSSGYFDGNSITYLELPSNGLHLDADFTIELWVYLNDASAYQYFMAPDVMTGGHFQFAINGMASNALGFGRTYVDWPLVFSGHNLANTTWHHIVVTRSGTENRCFLNGIQLGAAITSSVDWIFGPNLHIGHNVLVGTMTGYINDLRITKGVGRYTANFTPPSSPAYLMGPSLSPIPIVRQDGPDQSTKIARIGL